MSGYRKPGSSQSSAPSADRASGTGYRVLAQVEHMGFPVYVDKTCPPGRVYLMRKEDLPKSAKPLRRRVKP